MFFFLGDFLGYFLEIFKFRKFVSPLKSESSALAKAFSSFNLGSLSVSFAGFMGDFAVWAILDAFTGEITYLVDDNGGSEIIFPFIGQRLVGSNFSPSYWPVNICRYFRLIMIFYVKFWSWIFLSNP